MKPCRIISIFVLSLLLMACGPRKTPMELAQASFEAQNYRMAYKRLSPLANRGEPDAQYALGYLYYYGLGITEDRIQAERLFRTAAGSGHQKAARALAMLESEVQ